MDVTKVICTSNGGQLRLIFQQPFWNTWGVNIFVWVCVEWIKKLRAKCSANNRSDICITKYYHCLNMYVLAISSLKLMKYMLPAFSFSLQYTFLHFVLYTMCTRFHCPTSITNHLISSSNVNISDYQEKEKNTVVKVNFKQTRAIGTYCTA